VYKNEASDYKVLGRPYNAAEAIENDETEAKDCIIV
jgi:hypothetical protein